MTQVIYWLIIYYIEFMVYNHCYIKLYLVVTHFTTVRLLNFELVLDRFNDWYEF